MGRFATKWPAPRAMARRLATRLGLWPRRWLGPGALASGSNLWFSQGARACGTRKRLCLRHSQGLGLWASQMARTFGSRRGLAFGSQDGGAMQRKTVGCRDGRWRWAERGVARCVGHGGGARPRGVLECLTAPAGTAPEANPNPDPRTPTRISGRAPDPDREASRPTKPISPRGPSRRKASPATKPASPRSQPRRESNPAAKSVSSPELDLELDLDTRYTIRSGLWTSRG